MIHNTILQLALQLPGSSPIPGPSGLNPDIKDLGSFLYILLNIAFYVAAFITFYFLIWGAFLYMMAQGKKEELAKARTRIGWAIFGLVVVLLAYLVAKFAAEILKPKGGLPF